MSTEEKYYEWLYYYFKICKSKDDITENEKIKLHEIFVDKAPFQYLQYAYRYSGHANFPRYLNLTDMTITNKLFEAGDSYLDMFPSDMDENRSMSQLNQFWEEQYYQKVDNIDKSVRRILDLLEFYRLYPVSRQSVRGRNYLLSLYLYQINKKQKEESKQKERDEEQKEEMNGQSDIKTSKKRTKYNNSSQKNKYTKIQ